ncbi:Gfo/Idh/MocA family protein [Leifsonia poae]|uniref:Gfo/Idh/MocA family protein n=1 Tax=Leifsonia poae TaxID=110933 RepID=UPI001CBECFB6|nr:Gfo/Idh/MocA family oxidoreductase [Leifsonia poae]
MTHSLIQVGLGPWGTDWATTILPQVPGANVVAWVDASAQSREAFRAATNAPADSVFADLGSAVAATGAEAVIAPVAIPAHEAVAREAIDLGLHLLLEKPFVFDVRTAQSLVLDAEARGLTFVIDQNYRHFPAAPVVRGLLADGTLGTLRRVGVRWHRVHQGVSLSNALVELAIHHFDLMRYILGSDALAITCVTRPRISQVSDFAPEAHAIIEMSNGIVVDYTLTSQGIDATTPWPGQWCISGDDGELQWGTAETSPNEPSHEFVRLRAADGERQRVPIDTGVPFERVGVLLDFLASIETGAAPRSSAADNLGSVAMLEAALLSASGAGRVVIAS